MDFYKAHRPILDSDIIHVRRPDGRDYDAILHVNPLLEEKGMLVIHNPTSKSIRKNITLNVYYTGLHETVEVSKEGKKFLAIILLVGMIRLIWKLKWGLGKWDGGC